MTERSVPNAPCPVCATKKALLIAESKQEVKPIKKKKK